MESSKVKQELFDVNNENLQKLASLFPSAVKDGQLDIDALKEELGQYEEVGQEKYELTWAGKQNAKKEARRNVLGKTLRYIEGNGVDKDEYADTQNLYIEGDNLEVLKLLRKNYYGKIKMIYIDPPYNTGNDFVYNDNFSITQEELEKMQGERDEYNERLQKNTKDSARYHTNWLNMMYPRLQLAKDLLTEDGVIFISIDDNEVENLKKICDEAFGERNFVAQFVWKCRNSLQHDEVLVSKQTERIMLYVKEKSIWNNDTGIKFNRIRKPFDATEYKNPDNDPRGPWLSSGKTRNDGRASYTVVSPSGTKFTKPWIPSPAEFKRWEEEGLIWWGKNGDSIPRKKSFLKDFKGNAISDILMDEYTDEIKGENNIKRTKRWEIGTTESGTKGEKDLFDGKAPFDYPKPWTLIKYFSTIATNKDSIILDFFSGSATTAHAVMQLNAEDGGNRRYICVQLPEKTEESSEANKAGYENICEIGKERIRRAGKKIKEEIETKNQQLEYGEEPKKVPDIGFKVFRVGETTLNWEKLNLQGKDIYHDYIAGTSEKDKLDFTPDFKTDLNVVYEIMLRQEGLPLTSKIEKLTDIGSRTYLVADSYLISLEEDITPEMVEKLSTLNPLPIKFVFRDSAFDDNIVFKDETFRRLNALIDKITSDEKKTYTVEFI